MFSRSLFSSYVYRSCRCSMPVYMYACMCHDVRCRFDVCAARRWMPCEGSDESSIGNQNADPRLCIQQRSAAISHTINPVLTTYSRSHRCFYDHQLPIRDVKLFIHDSTLPIRRCVLGFVASGNICGSYMSTIETMVRCHFLLCLLTEWSHHCTILFLRYLPLDPPLLLKWSLSPSSPSSSSSSSPTVCARIAASSVSS